MPATASTSLDVILRRSGLTDEMLRSAGVRPPSPGAPASAIAHEPAGAPAAAKTAQPAPRQPRASLEPSQRRETSSTAAKPPVPANRKSPVQREPRPAASFSGFLEDERPKIQLPGDGRLLSDVAADLGRCLADVLFTRGGEVVELKDGLLAPVSPQRFRTLIEKYVLCFRQTSPNGHSIQIDATLTESDSRGVLVAQQLHEHLRPLRRVNTVRLPVQRADGSIERLAGGYDRQTGTLTLGNAMYAEDMPVSEAVKTIRNVFSEFLFADGDRSLSVALSAQVGLYAAQLLPEGALRPCFIVTKNAEGAGATTLVSCAVVPILGWLPTGVAPGEEPEMRKMLTAAVREGRPVVLFDNQKSHLSSGTLEAFITSARWSDRLLGSNDTFTGQNLVTTFVTANGCTFSPDMRRRSLIVELHLDVELAENRQFRRPLDEPTLLAMRPKILAALWSLVRHWDEQGRPEPSRSHSAFPTWAKVVGGIVEAAGFGCPLETARISIVGDEDTQHMRALTTAMKPGTAYTSVGLVELCRRVGAFDGLVGEKDADMGRAQRTAFGRLLARYNQRRVGESKFLITGSGHGKRFSVLRAEDQAGRLQ